MDSLFYHGCSAKDAKIGSKMPRRLKTLTSLGLATVTIAGCTGIIISSTIPTTTSTSCKGFGAMK